MRIWTDKAKADHAALMREKIRTWAPWKQSTGPRTASGKKRVSLNAMKHGLRSKQGRRLLGQFRKHHQFLKMVELSLKYTGNPTNKLINRTPPQTLLSSRISFLHNFSKRLE